jgi:hypothetical protein
MGDRGDSSIGSMLSQLPAGYSFPAGVTVSPGMYSSPPPTVPREPPPPAPTSEDGGTAVSPPPPPTYRSSTPLGFGMYDNYSNLDPPYGYHWDTRTNSYQLNPDYLVGPRAGDQSSTAFPAGAMNQLYGGWNG